MKKKKVAIHLTSWVGYFLLLSWVFDFAGGGEFVIRRTFFLVITQAAIFYFNSEILLPFIYEKKKYLQYGFSLIGVLIFTVLLLHTLEKFQQLPKPPGFEGRPFNPDRFEKRKQWFKDHNMDIDRRGKFRRGMPIHIRSIFGSVLAIFPLFMSMLYRNSIVNKLREEQEYLLKNRMLEAETLALKSQINPHFLFNTLNNLYALAQVKSEKTPEAIHQLSEMLRYVIYDSNSKFVPLGKEIKYIESYIELQLLKDDRIKNINYEFEQINPQLSIAPMLLIPFVENSFKHSRFEDPKNGWINIVIKTEGNSLTFENSNSIPKVKHTKDGTGGVGLENIYKRLELLYPHKYSINIDNTSEYFKVSLYIEELTDNN